MYFKVMDKEGNMLKEELELLYMPKPKERILLMGENCTLAYWRVLAAKSHVLKVRFDSDYKNAYIDPDPGYDDLLEAATQLGIELMEKEQDNKCKTCCLSDNGCIGSPELYPDCYVY